MALIDAVRRLKTGQNETGEKYTVTRTARSTFVDGRAVPGATSTFTIVACIQPMSEPMKGRMLHILPEAQHTEEIRIVHTETELRSGAEPDSISIDGEPWKVIGFQRWQAFGTHEHFKAFVARETLP